MSERSPFLYVEVMFVCEAVTTAAGCMVVSGRLSGMQGESVGSLGAGSLGRWAVQIDDAHVQMEAQQRSITSRLRTDEPTASMSIFQAETAHGAGE